MFEQPDDTPMNCAYIYIDDIPSSCRDLRKYLYEYCGLSPIYLNTHLSRGNAVAILINRSLSFENTDGHMSPKEAKYCLQKLKGVIEIMDVTY